MPWLHKIQNKTHKEKLRIIWTVVIIVAIALVVVWVATSQIAKKYRRAGDLFHAVNGDINQEQKYYQKNMQENGVQVNDRFNLAK